MASDQYPPPASYDCVDLSALTTASRTSAGFTYPVRIANSIACGITASGISPPRAALPFLSGHAYFTDSCCPAPPLPSFFSSQLAIPIRSSSASVPEHPAPCSEDLHRSCFLVLAGASAANWLFSPSSYHTRRARDLGQSALHGTTRARRGRRSLRNALGYYGVARVHRAHISPETGRLNASA